ncbi:MAG: hypothetical protein LBQ28_07680 [Prevotellaceae bacterium]|nr:hypothetical protein [Prevotellaceae bacterium]
MVSLDNISVSFGEFTLIDNISIMINSSDSTGLVCKNKGFCRNSENDKLRFVIGH